MTSGQAPAVSPYEGLPAERYWRTGVAQQTPETVTGLYQKRFEILPSDRIATAGSCFAQHIARNLKSFQCQVLDFEPAPPFLAPETAKKFGYSLYSARYGNIYTIQQLHQLVLETYDELAPADVVWERDGRFFDALRPSVEPNGLEERDLVIRHRKQHLLRVRKVFNNTDVLIFTFGLTEAWRHKASGTIYPTAPGTIAGRFDPEVHEFKNFSAAETLASFEQLYAFLKRKKPTMRFLLTVSPVPLTATATQHHVLTATTYSKAVLRAVCGDLVAKFDDVDYFPSYELIASPFSRGAFFESNLRSVTDAGVATAMRVFFAEHSNLTAARAAEPEVADEPKRKAKSDAQEASKRDDLVCDELLLEAFSKRP